MSRLGCRENAEALLEYAAGRMSAAAAEQLERHLAGCEECRAMVRGQRQVWEALEAWEAPATSPDFDRRLYGRIGEERPWLQRFFGSWLAHKALPAAAAAGLLIAAGLIVNRPASVPQGPPVSYAEPLRPEQVESAVQDMELLRELNGLVFGDSADPRM